MQRQLLLAAALPIVVVGLLNGLWLERLFRANPTAFWLADVGTYVVLPALGFAALGAWGDIWPRHYGFRAFGGNYSRGAQIGLFPFVVFLYWLFYNPVREIAHSFLRNAQPGFSYGDALPHWGLYKAFTLVYLSATAAFVEEAVFRSLPWLYFSLRFPGRRFTGAYVAATSIAFGAIHSEQGMAAVIAATSVGAIAAVMYAKLQNVWPFVVAHFVTDLAAFG